MKNFIKVLDEESNGFSYFRGKLLKIIEEQLKEVIFVGPQMREIITHGKYEAKLIAQKKTK